jgi:DNA polymerase (family 10)
MCGVVMSMGTDPPEGPAIDAEYGRGPMRRQAFFWLRLGAMSLNSKLAEMFQTMAAVLEIRGEPVFKAIAFTRVARALDDSTIDIAKAVQDGTLDQIKGVGASSRKVIEDVVRNGRSSDYDELIATIPAGLIELLGISGLGPKTIAKLWRERDIKSIAELSAAIDSGKLEGLAGIGAKKIEQIKQGIEMLATAGKRMGLPFAMELAQTIVAQVKALPGVSRAEPAGSLRRCKETVGDLDILATISADAKPAEITEAFTKFQQVTHVLGQGDTKSSVMTDAGIQVDLRIVPPDHFGAALQYFTGSKEHNVHLRQIAQERGLTLNDWGLYKDEEWEKAKAKAKGKDASHAATHAKAIASKSEAEIYAALDLAYVEPELREDRGEVELAQQNKLPKLIVQADLVGELHCHTTASDGTASIEEMAQRAKELGYAYIVITDHSKSQVQARGLDAKRLLAHAKEVRKVNDKLKGIEVLIGTECDILADGHLDYEDAVLAELDFVVASPHTALRQERDKATERMLRAIDNKYVNVIGHPTGRLINQRPGLEFDWDAIFKAAAQSGTALEINASWPRLDLDDVRARSAISAGVMLTIDTDAHSARDLGSNELGIAVARRAGATVKHVLNAQPLAAVRKWVAAKR